MKQRVFKCFLVVLLIFVLFTVCSFSAFAHSGGTDSKGGHYNRTTGEYHYHHGYSEHNHANGICSIEARNYYIRIAVAVAIVLVFLGYKMFLYLDDEKAMKFFIFCLIILFILHFFIVRKYFPYTKIYVP